MEGGDAHAGLVRDDDVGIALEAGAEHLGHHAPQRRDHDLAERGQAFVRALEGGEIHDQDAAVENHVAHVDVGLPHLEDVAKRDAEELEGVSEVELGEAVLLRGLLGLLPVPVEAHVVGRQFAEIGLKGIDQVLRHFRDGDVGRLAGHGVADLEHPLRRDLPDAAELEGETDRLDVERHVLVVAHPDEDRGQRADERHGALAEDAVGVARRRLAEQARQHLADRVGVADRERVEAVRILDPGRHHEIQAKHVVLAPEPAGERQDLAVELVVCLAVDDHEARGVGQRIGEERQKRGRLAGAGRAGHGRMLAAVLEGDPELPAVDVPAEMDRALGHARPASLRGRVVPVAHARGARQAKRQGDAPGEDEPGVENRGGGHDIHERRLDEHEHGAAREHHARELAHHR